MTAKPRAAASASKAKTPSRRAKTAPSTPAPAPAKKAKPVKAKVKTAPAGPNKSATSTKPTTQSRKPAAAPADPKPPESAATSPPPRPAASAPIAAALPVESPIEPAKSRRRGLGSLSKHAFSPVAAPLHLVTKPRPAIRAELPSEGLPAALPADAVGFLRAELAAMLALLEEPTGST